MKIDVCIVSRTNKLPQGLQWLPVNRLIVEDMKPVGAARAACIARVETPVFAFIDDDITISKTWFEGLLPFLSRDDVGAVWGTIRNKGLGIFDVPYASIIPYGELKKSDRLNTNNTLIKTELVKDWQPTIGLNCYEDLDMGRHIMNKGYKILNVPCDTVHSKGFVDVATSAFWAGSRYIEAYCPTEKQLLKQWLRRISSPLTQIFTHGLLSSAIVAYRNFFFLSGLLWSELQRVMGNKLDKN